MEPIASGVSVSQSWQGPKGSAPWVCVLRSTLPPGATPMRALRAMIEDPG